LGEKTVRPAEGGTPNSLGKLGGNQWDALRASHALGASVSFSTKLEPAVGFGPTTYCLQNSCSAAELRWRQFCQDFFQFSPARDISGIKFNRFFKALAGIVILFRLDVNIAKPPV
ncbi:MAG: hypothetical protein CEN90_174, partial [Parcubacteria group bacterium Licking1014_17]